MTHRGLPIETVTVEYHPDITGNVASQEGTLYALYLVASYMVTKVLSPLKLEYSKTFTLERILSR